jgi:hypothetical protein
MVTEIKTTRKKPWYKKWWGILIIIFLFFGFIGGLLDDSKKSEDSSKTSTQGNLDNAIVLNSVENSSSNEDIPTKLQALNECYKKSKECSEGMLAVEKEFRNTCLQIYSYTSDAKEDILSLANLGEEFC